jgi:hypothetical protein
MSVLDFFDPFDIFDGGDSSVSSETTVHIDSTSTNTSTLDLGLDDINTEVTLKAPDPIETKGTNTIEVKPLDLDLKNDTHLTVDPLRTDSGLSVDVKPIVLDLCLTANVGKLPNLCIRQPYNHHVGFTLYGMELWGVTVSGEQQTVIEELDRQPKVQWGGAMSAWPPVSASSPATRREPPTRSGGGLRIRLGT